MEKRLVIVALGDSLTVGFQSNNPFMPPTPYTHYLTLKIEEMFKELKEGRSVYIYNKGIVGDLTSGMLHRFYDDVISLKPEYVIILGGSNDIGWGFPPSMVFKNLEKMYSTARKHGIEPIACTIPSILGFDSLIPPRIELNNLIKDYCEKNKVPLADLFTITSDPNTKRLREEYSDDGLHLTTEGYKKIADVIFEVLRDLIVRKMNL
ncbi:MAG: GDSL-type esterase/lipase family protein [Nitrososphaerota archaeon]|nr:GDSL-type esterase/lipase family protein [Nitrososphaerales archaeon]MDW8045444.1 GDSL-type esterase/lipase family protein [Nitrososphaerota archaeon]